MSRIIVAIVFLVSISASSSLYGMGKDWEEEVSPDVSVHHPTLLPDPSDATRPRKRVHFETPQSPNPLPQRASSRLAHQALHPFKTDLESATQTHNVAAIERLLRAFRALPLSEAQWAEIAASDHVLVWPGQSHKDAVGADLFLNAAFNEPHQNLLRNAMQPLLTVKSNNVSFDDAYATVTARVEHVMKRHPYLQRRMALFALVAATRLKNPLARFFLARALPSDVDENFRDHETAAAGECLREEQAQRCLRIFIDVPGIEAFVDDLQGADEKDEAKLKAKAALGLVHYNYLLSHIYFPSDSILAVSDEDAHQAIDHARVAAIGADWDGCERLFDLSSGAINRNRLYHTQKEKIEKRTEAWKFLEHAAWHGLEGAYSHASIANYYNQCGIAGTRKAVFRKVIRFLGRSTVQT